MTKTPFFIRPILAALLLCGASAQAATFTFSGTMDSGPLNLSGFSGQYSYSDVPAGFDGDALLTSFSLSFAGQVYTLDSATATGSAAVFANGTFIGLSYTDDASQDPAARPQVTFATGFFDLSQAYLAYVGAGGQSGAGSYSISAVPEPASALLMALGLGLGLGTVASRRYARQR